MRCLFTSAILAAALQLSGLFAGQAGTPADVIVPPPVPAETLDDPEPGGEVVAALVARVTIDGVPARGTWFKLSGSVTGAVDITAIQWVQRGGPKYEFLSAARGQRDLWLFLNTPGQYAFAFRARSGEGWSAPAEVQFAIDAERPVLAMDEALKRVGSCERVVLPGPTWRQIAGPITSLAAQQDAGGYALRPNDPGLYLFEAARLTPDMTPLRRGIFVPTARDGKSGDRRPQARLIKQYSGIVGLPVELDGALSSDPDPGDTAALTARWSTPDLSRGVELVPLPGLRARFSAQKPGMYKVLLVVSDGRLDSLPERTFVEITDGSVGTSSLNKLLEPTNSLVNETAPDTLSALLQRRVSLAIWPPTPLDDGTVLMPEDGGVQRAIQLFPMRCGTSLRVDAGVAKSGHFHELPLAIEARNTPLLHLIDGIARQTDTCYRRDGTRGFWLVRPGDCPRSENLEIAAVNVDALFQKPDAPELMEPLHLYADPLIRGRSEASLTFDADRHAVSAMLPATAARHVREMMLSLREPAPKNLPLPVIGIEELVLRNRLGEKMVNLKGYYRLDNLVRELSEQTGVAVAYDPRAFKGPPPHLRVNWEQICLRQVLRDLVDEACFSGCSIEAPSGAWLYKGVQPYASGESLWDTAYVVAYDLTPLYRDLTPEASLMLSGETIAHFIRSRVFSGSWSDPGTFLFYHEATRKLVVLHGTAAHVKIVELLNDLRDRGEWALGVTY